jgi:hypothetical protein
LHRLTIAQFQCRGDWDAGWKSRLDRVLEATAEQQASREVFKAEMEDD